MTAIGFFLIGLSIGGAIGLLLAPRIAQLSRLGRPDRELGI